MKTNDGMFYAVWIPEKKMFIAPPNADGPPRPGPVVDAAILLTLEDAEALAGLAKIYGHETAQTIKLDAVQLAASVGEVW